MRRKENGNTLVPVIISLAISAVATIAFLNQGADLSNKNRRLIAQHEIITELQNWNITKAARGLGNMVQEDLPPVRMNNALGGYVRFFLPNILFNRPTIEYEADSVESCQYLKRVITSRNEGISSNLFNGADNPICINEVFFALLD